VLQAGPQEPLVPRVAPEGLHTVATVGAHHRRIIIHGEIYPDLRLAALAEATIDQVRNPEDLGRSSRSSGRGLR
jgi:hypothetical protein